MDDKMSERRCGSRHDLAEPFTFALQLSTFDSQPYLQPNPYKSSRIQVHSS